MTSSRGQNVPPVQLRGTECLESDSTAVRGTRSNVSRIGQDTFMNGRSLSQHSLESPLAGTNRCSLSEAFSSSGKCPSTCILNSSGSSSSVNRELSPVRWCDREVDGVYLGRSGWVQVQQRSLDESNETSFGQNTPTSAFHSKKHSSSFNSTTNSLERKERNRPINLALPSKRRTNVGLYRMPSDFLDDFPSVPPPTVTPILSPPPAFRDEGIDNQIPSHSLKQPFYSERSLHLKPLPVADSGGPATVMSPIGLVLHSTLSPVSPKHYSHRFLQTKSLDENSLERRNQIYGHYNSVGLMPLSGSRSLDGDGTDVDSKDSSSNFSLKGLKGFHGTEKKAVCEDECDSGGAQEGNFAEKNDFSKRRAERQTSSSERLNSQRDLPKPFRQTKYQLNGKRAIINDTGCPYRARSPSSDSNSSNSSGSSDSSRRYQNLSSRRSARKQCSPHAEKFNGGCTKHFSVKRSRSLQLSEERPPREVTLMSHSSSGKSWDRTPEEYSESITFQPENESDQHHSQSLRNLENVMVTVNGRSIPVISPGDPSCNPLNKITTSEEARKQLIREAAKEARIISEFLNGTRSRAAARNLLMHRYFTHSEASSPELNETNISSKTSSESRFSRSVRRLPHKSTAWNGVAPHQGTHTLYPVYRDVREHPEPVYTKPFTPSYNSSTPTETHSFQHLSPIQTQKGDTGSVSSRQTTDTRSKRKHQIQHPVPHISLHPSSRTPPFTPPTQKQTPKTIKNPSPGPLTNITNYKIFTQLRGHILQQNSSSSSSSDTSDYDEPKKSYKNSTTSDLSPDCICLQSTLPSRQRPRDLRNRFHSRLVSASETEDCAVNFGQRSLSLPRSFLSDQCGLGHLNRRKSFPWRQDGVQSPSEDLEELTEEMGSSRTAPTTPVRESRDERNLRTRNGIKRKQSPCITLLDETVFSGIEWAEQRDSEETKTKNSSANGGRTLKGSETATQNIQNMPLKPSKGNQLSRESCHKSAARKTPNHTQRTSQDVASPVESHAIQALTTLPSHDKNSGQLCRYPDFELKKEQILRSRALMQDKYDSHDSGIQVGIRGNVDSSESQDTDFQEDVGNQGGSRRRTQIFGRSGQKGVRRTKSDLGGLWLVNREVQNNAQRFIAGSSPLRDSLSTALLRSLSPEDSLLFHRSLKHQLRRSLSLNELPPSARQGYSHVKHAALSEDEKNLGGNSDDELLSDSESSAVSFNERKKSWRAHPKGEAVMLAEAVWDHVAMESFELPFRAGDVIEVLDSRDQNWWWGSTDEHCGYFPSTFVRLRVGQGNAVENRFPAATSIQTEVPNKYDIRRGKSSSIMSNEQVRSSVVRELLNTEREFVKILRDVKDGYIAQCNRRPDMFTSAQISTIFSNLEEILTFQEQFLSDLERRIDEQFPHKSCVGEIFLNHSMGFRKYSEYCNSHPMAMATLQELWQINNYNKFFEMCRLKQNLTEIPLAGYLLTPIQRICKYPLQLAELLKYTKPDHPDFDKVEKALETMRSVATLINERKRKMESLEKLAAWQQRVEGWEGEDLIELSSRLIYQGDVVRITSGMWTTNITLFLFDHQIIYCKKDLLKRNNHIYKGRICLDSSEVVDLPDGKNQELGVSIKYGIKICSTLKEKWLVFCCRSSEDKTKWLQALAEEKRLVAQDKEGGLDLPPTAKQLADMAARTKKIIPSKLRGKNKITGHDEDTHFRNGNLNLPKVKGSLRMGTWFTFGGVMKSPKVSLRHRASSQQMS